MLTAADFVRLPYTPDLSQAGIAYACRSLAHTYDRMGGTPWARLRRIAGGVAVELAFRRYLAEQGVPFDVLGATPFTDPDHYDLALGGHRCDIKSYLVTRREAVERLRDEPAGLLQAQALLPLDQFAAEGHRPDDLYLFAFLLGRVATSPEHGHPAQTDDRPAYLVHHLPDAWARPPAWLPLAPLALKSECPEPIRVEIGGQEAGRDFQCETVELPPRTRRLAGGDFHSLAYLHPERLPEARLGVHSPRLGRPYLVPPYEWGDIWIDGIGLLLAGWMSREEFRRRAVVLRAGSRTFQYDRTRTKNLAVPVSGLMALAPLLERVRAWGAAGPGREAAST